MGLIRKTVATVGLAGTAAAAYLTSSTTLVVSMPKDDPMWTSQHLKKLNRFDNPIVSDLCTKRIPLSKIRPELRDDEAALGLAFSRALWSGWGMAPQRILLTKLFQGQPEMASQLFSKADLASSSYESGTQLINHFEVLEQSPRTGEVVVRGGGSPVTQRGPRETDGVLATRVRIDRAAGEVKVILAAVFFDGVHHVQDGRMPIPYPAELLHRLYARAIVLSGAQGLTR